MPSCTMPIILLFYILCVAIFETAGQSFLKLANTRKTTIYFILGIASYAFVSTFLYLSYTYKGVGLVNALWSGISILMMMLVGYFFFKERFATTELIGVGLILAGIIVIATHHTNRV